MISVKHVNDAIKRLKELQGDGDVENSHLLADEIILEFVPESVGEEWKKVKKWYS